MWENFGWCTSQIMILCWFHWGVVVIVAVIFTECHLEWCVFTDLKRISQLLCLASLVPGKLFRQSMPCATLRLSVVLRPRPKWRSVYWLQTPSWRCCWSSWHDVILVELSCFVLLAWSWTESTPANNYVDCKSVVNKLNFVAYKIGCLIRLNFQATSWAISWIKTVGTVAVLPGDNPMFCTIHLLPASFRLLNCWILSLNSR